MLAREFAERGEIKPVEASEDATNNTQPTYHKTSDTAWESNQQAVSCENPKTLYSVTKNPNEKAITGDGYSVTNGKVNGHQSSVMTDFFSKEDGDTEKANKWYELKKTRLIVIDHKDPGLMMKPGSTPSKSQLVVEDKKGNEVKQYVGTIESPNIYKEISDKYLFTDAGPDQNDVKQNSVGDCYFWGAVLQILAHDPNKLTSMIKLNDQTVNITMYHKEGDDWVASTLSRPLGMGGLNCQYAETQTKIETNCGEAGVRIDIETPCESAWKATIDGTDCLIDRTDFYKAALWANCLEQAYSDFTRTYGQYGAGFRKTEAGKEEFESGCTNYCYNMFYGSKAEDLGVPQNNEQNHDQILQSLVDFKKTLKGEEAFTALAARKISGDPTNNGAHVFSIENISLLDKNGKPVDLTGEVDLSKIDINQSKILMRNPWNSTYTSTGKYFEVSLDDFFSNGQWTHVYMASISERTPKDAE